MYGTDAAAKSASHINCHNRDLVCNIYRKLGYLQLVPHTRFDVENA